MFFKRSIQSIATTWVTGLLVLLPLIITLALVAWVASLLNSLVGPSTLLGQLMAAIGEPIAARPSLAYFIGAILLLAALYPLGLAVNLGLRGPLTRLTKATVSRVPILGNFYNMADSFVSMLDRHKDPDIKDMQPVWCFFGGDGAAVLGLMPRAEPVNLNGKPHLAVLVPTAPIPVGGGLIYVPAAWVQQADIGVETLTAVYVSMGITAPPDIPAQISSDRQEQPSAPS